MWHAGIFGPGVRVLDLACGRGRHAIAAAQRGAQVVAVDNDSERLDAARRRGRDLPIEWITCDLGAYPLPPEEFDVVMAFNYLERSRMPAFRAAVRRGGYLMYETFLQAQRDYGWGPTSDEHLLGPGELISLVQPFEILLAREALEFIGGRPMAVSSVLAQRPI